MALNHITIMGRLTADPSLRRTGSGIPVASFTIACDRDFGGQDGQKETDFIDCVAWRQTGEFVSKYFTKGRMIVVSGRLQIRQWKDKDEKNRKTAEVVADHCYFGDSKTEGSSHGGGYNNAPAPGGYNPPASSYQGNNTGGYQNSGYQQQSYGHYPAPEYYPDAGPEYPMMEGDPGDVPF